MYTFVILLSAFKYKRKIAYAVLKMIVHKAKKKKGKETANKLIKQALFTPEKYCTLYMKQ